MGKPPAPLLPEELKSRVRIDFQTTDLSLRALARRHGIKSENTIRQWRDKEGWKRDQRAITANLLTRAIALPDEIIKPAHVAEREAERTDGALSGQILQFPKAPAGPAAPAAHEMRKNAHEQNQGVDQKGPAIEPQNAEKVGTKRPGHPLDARPDAQATVTPPARASRPNKSRMAALDNEDRLDVSAAQALADIHARAIRKHSALADKIMATGAAILDDIQIIASMEGLEDHQLREAAVARQRLTAINTDKETLAGLMRAGAAVVQLGIKIQRQVLGMDLAGPPGLEKPSAAETAPKSLTNLLSLPTLRELREIAAEQAAMRPAAAPAAASPIIEHAAAAPAEPSPGATPDGEGQTTN